MKVWTSLKDAVRFSARASGPRVSSGYGAKSSFGLHDPPMKLMNEIPAGPHRFQRHRGHVKAAMSVLAGTGVTAFPLAVASYGVDAAIFSSTVISSGRVELRKDSSGWRVHDGPSLPMRACIRPRAAICAPLGY